MPSLKFLKKIVDHKQPNYKSDHPAYELYQKRYRKERRDAGLCTYCPRLVKAGNKWMCEVHIQQKRVYDRKRLERRRRAGLCRVCDSPVGEVNKTWCVTHRIRQLVYMKKSNLIRTNKKKAGNEA